MAMQEHANNVIKLKQAPATGPVRVIAVTSGKGGVGKTNVSINLASYLSKSGNNVMLMDADLGLANVDVLLGLSFKYDISHVLSGEKTLEEVIVTTANGLRVVPASSGIQRMAELSPVEHAGLIRAFSDLPYNIDTLIIDTAAGISDSVISFSKASQEVIVVVCDEPTSITDAYALIKLLSNDYGINRFRILSNMVRSAQEGRDLYNKIVKVTDEFLDVALDYMGAIPFDEYLRKAIQQQKAVVDAYPRSKSALTFNKLAHKVNSWPMPNSAGGNLEFFVERLILASQKEAGVSL